MNRSFRSKPVGWRNESYRHYLAMKGIASRIPPHKYFATIVNDAAKGNREGVNPDLPKEFSVKHWQAKGYSKDEIPDYVLEASGAKRAGENKQTFMAVGGVQVKPEELQSLPIGGVPESSQPVAQFESPAVGIAMQESASVPDLGIPGANLAPEMDTNQTFSPAFSEKAVEVPRHENLDDTAANMTPGSPGMVTDEFEVTTG